MSGPLILFPDRVPIGSANGVPVYMTVEFSRALAALLVRVGGPVGLGTSDIAVEAAQAAATVQAHVLAQPVADLQSQLEAVASLSSRLGELRKQVADLEAALASTPAVALVARLERVLRDHAALGVEVQRPTDWEHPGKIGAGKAGTGAFTTLSATSVAASAGVTAATYNKVTLVQPANGAGIQISDQRTFKCTNNITLSGNDGASLNILAGGTLGSAAYANTGAFAARSATALAAPATDAATTQTLANNLRSVLLSVGIGT